LDRVSFVAWGILASDLLVAPVMLPFSTRITAEFGSEIVDKAPFLFCLMAAPDLELPLELTLHLRATV